MSKQTVCRDVNKLHPYCRQQALKVVAEAKSKGLNVEIFETTRTFERQKWLKSNGKSKTIKSYHRLGLAVDFVFKTKSGNWTWRVAQSKWDQLAAIIEAQGFYSLGKRKGWDYPHGQINLKGLTVAKLYKGLEACENDLQRFYDTCITPALETQKLWGKPIEKKEKKVLKKKKKVAVKKVVAVEKATQEQVKPWWAQIFDFFGGK